MADGWRFDRFPAVFCFLFAGWLGAAGSASAQLAPNSLAPKITLADSAGNPVELNNQRASRLLLLFFFDVESRSSLDALATVNLLAQRHPADVAVYGISSSPPDVIQRYQTRHGIGIPVLRADSKARELYQAKVVLPVVCLIGRDSRVISYHQGGGVGLSKALSEAIQRELRGQSPHFPKAAAKGDAVAKPGERAKRRHPKDQQATAPTEEKVQQNRVGKLLNEKEW